MTQEHTESQVFDAVWQVLSRRVLDRAVSAVELADEILHNYGKVQRREQELYAGDRVLNRDRELLSRLSRATGLGFSIYLGNRRISSVSVIDAGDPLELGGFADATLVDTVLRRREVFKGSLDIGGHRYMVACRPLYATEKPDEYGAMGMLEAFQDESGFREMLSSSIRGHGSTATASELQADRMESVMHFIDDVARRLQLLALNGNIIAAQAGDHGRAFRVVCRELSSLAEQSKEAVAEVRKLTQEMGLDTHDHSLDMASIEQPKTLESSSEAAEASDED